MATLGAARGGLNYAVDQRFFLTLSTVLAVGIAFAFMQWAARGFVDPLTAPVWLHFHGLTMVAWLGLLVLQNWLALRGRLQLHRRLGWASLSLLPVIAVLGVLTGVWAVDTHRVPPFWSNGDMLALAVVQVTAFEALVIAAIILRRQTDWHRRLMVGATIVLMKAALDRLLPLPLLGTAAPVAEAVAQLAVVAVLARHDWRRFRKIHPATWCVAMTVVATHVTMRLLASLAPFASLADRIAA